jgi:hypothetical protein
MRGVAALTASAAAARSRRRVAVRGTASVGTSFGLYQYSNPKDRNPYVLATPLFGVGPVG